jgi:hypothetical protein
MPDFNKLSEQKKTEKSGNTEKPESASMLDELDHKPIGFGMYKVYTPDQISEFDPGYICWAVETVTNRGKLVSDVLYRACLPERDKKRRLPPKLDSFREIKQGQRVQKILAPGSLAESRSHFDDPDEDDIPF